jgi:hypothetical protein
MTETTHLPYEQLEAGLEAIRQAPCDIGELKLIVRRPTTDAREVLNEGQLDVTVGLDGDNWKTRGSTRTKDGSSNPETQITVMNARVIALLSPDRDRWPLAGDQLYVDFDLSETNVPAGTRLAIGEAVIEVTPPPHTGCGKFAARFGKDAVKFVNSEQGKALHMRGINTKVIKSGPIRVGDVIKKIQP